MVVLSNLYIVITFLLGITLLREPVTALKIGGLVLTLGGVLLLANPPSSRYAVHSATSVAKKAPPARAFVLMGGYVVIIGIGAFLEKAGFARARCNAAERIDGHRHDRCRPGRLCSRTP